MRNAGRPVWASVVDCGIHRVRGEFKRASAYAEAQHDLGMAREKRRQPGNQPTGCKRRKDGQIQIARGSGPSDGAMRRRTQIVEDPGDVGQISSSRICELYALVNALEQTNVQVVFQLPNLAANRALRQVQFRCSSGNAAVPGCALERQQARDRGQVSSVQFFTSTKLVLKRKLCEHPLMT